MITFLVCLALLVTAYFTYGRYLERLVGIDPAARTPCSRLYDGVDYVPLPRWRIFLIQLLNIAGLGPIFGAVLGAAYGPVAFLWITFGGIFMGAAHDFIAGVISLRHDGASLPETAGVYLGGGMKIVMRLFSAGLMILVGAVFLSQPASLVAARLDVPSLEGIAFGGFSWLLLIVLGVILVYYIAATLLPVDKIIGRIYPVFGFALLFMAVGILVVLLFGGEYTIPEFTSFENCIADAKAFPIVPMLFTTIACGAISGFHATQSPLMARCMRNERESRPCLLRRDDLRVDHRPRLGRHCHGLLGRCRGAERRHRRIRRPGGRDDRRDRQQDAGPGAGRLRDLRRGGLRHHLGRHGLPFRAADRRRLHGRRAAHAAQTHLYLYSALRVGTS